jgi:hypothetical protein
VNLGSHFGKYRKNGIIIDTNLMLLIAVGTFNLDRIGTFKRTLKYTPRDFALMKGIMACFERRVTTPGILTEVDNLARQMPTTDHEGMSATINNLAAAFFEIHTPSVEIMKSKYYARLGLTDSAIIAAETKLLVVTDDFRLSSVLASSGRDVININHLRTFE